MILSRIPFTTPFSHSGFFRAGILHAVAGALASSLQIAVYVCAILYRDVYGDGHLFLPLLSLGLIAGLSYTSSAFLLLKTSRHLSHSPYTALPRVHVRWLQSLLLANLLTSVLLLATSAYLLIPLSTYTKDSPPTTTGTPVSSPPEAPPETAALGALLVHAALGGLALGVLVLSGITVRRCPLPPLRVVLTYAPTVTPAGWDNKGFAREDPRERTVSWGSEFSRGSSRGGSMPGAYQPRPGVTTF
ncbi:uncharacterized protein LOC129590987 [Paramacrobiotus metropolitanus]|uniref:uncharacterized protein LOC129590987 n=1 Tax=Paramacrobiotus metropolitanus TaxID=2943436 RepID=UPI0024459467|nr:uncharacterized protein LOC129590987 [Paramacrobiotus metropolitanus]